VVFALSLRPDPVAAPHTVDVGPSAERLPGS
jgi:hypothetical protein